jgi:prepilin-type N-terminal cleavage/methylation domain-containing protein
VLKSKNGFTLVELIVVICILGVLIFTVLIVINPLKQLNESLDATRLHDLGQIQIALNAYYNDHNLFPQTISFGQKWTGNDTTYMQKVPQDPAHPLQSYLYFVDANSSPQWSVVFAKLSETPTQKMCDLPDNCLPQGYTTQWACKTSGIPDCSLLASSSVAGQSIPSGTNSTNPTGDKCQYTSKQFPNQPREMMAYLWKDNADFAIYEPSFPGTPNPWQGAYSIDVSTNQDFSGPSCSTCETYNGFGKAWDVAAVGWAAQSLGGEFADGLVFEFNNTYATLTNATHYQAPRMNYVPIANLWSKYQCGKTIYWRYSAWGDSSQVTATHADTISCEIPDRIGYSTWLKYYPKGNLPGSQTQYDSKWDVNCDGKLDYKDYYMLWVQGREYYDGW